MYAQLQNQIGDYGELLKDCELKVCCDFIERLGAMQDALAAKRKAVIAMDSTIDLLRVKIGEVDVGQASQEYMEQEKFVRKQFQELTDKGNLLINYAEECEEYASDKEERELTETTLGNMRAFLSSVSERQVDTIQEQLNNLEKINRDIQSALNKEDVKRTAFNVINDLEKQFANMNLNIETGWSSL